MTDEREIKREECHPLQGPHVDAPPGGFVPLRLLKELEQVHIEIDCPVAIAGRHSGAGLRLGFPEVSRRHCRFAFENGQWRVYDLESLNGLFLNGERIVEATLYAGDRLCIANVKLLIETATPIRFLQTPNGEKHEKLRQIVEALPSDATLRAS
jgi:pSer/pThr/pTyr-binding forkhead associated (FHA) protein